MQTPYEMIDETKAELLASSGGQLSVWEMLQVWPDARIRGEELYQCCHHGASRETFSEQLRHDTNLVVVEEASKSEDSIYREAPDQILGIRV